MQVRFTEIDQSYIKAMVRDGYYATENELVRDAVRRLREQREAQQLLAAVRLGDMQIEQNETVPYSSDLLSQLAQKAVERALKNEMPSSDVTP